MLRDKIIGRKPGILLYGLTPPKQEYTNEKAAEIAQRQIERINSLAIDGLILYDIQDETSRTDKIRPFPFLPTLDPQQYYDNYLNSCKIPAIIYKCVSKYTHGEFVQWLRRNEKLQKYTVFVGSASKDQKVNLSIKQAYELKRSNDLTTLLGGVTIPERHLKKNDEHLRIFEKMEFGCQFFVSQAVYNLDASKDLISDIYYYSIGNQLKPAPLIFTLTPCGSIKTLQFMEWLGISIPKWLRNDLEHCGDILSKSMKICYKIAEELVQFSTEKNIPIGFNIESVAIRKAEIEASIELLNNVKGLLDVSYR
jgi:hypothetical protein